MVDYSRRILINKKNRSNKNVRIMTANNLL